MKHFITSILLSAIFSVTAFAQDADFIPGWYMVEKSALYSDGTMEQNEWAIADTSETSPLYAGEAVFAYMKIGGVYFCVHLTKDKMSIKGNNPLTKITATEGKVGFLKEDVPLMETDLKQGSCFWVLNIDAGSGQATILLNNGKKENIKSSSIDILAKWINKMLSLYTYKSVQ